MEPNESDVAWTEHDYYNGHNGHSSNKQPNALFQLFSDGDDGDELDEFEFFFRGLTKTDSPIIIRGESHCGHTKVLKSTGLAVWSGGDIMPQFLVSNSSFVEGKQVLELGSGTGVCSIVASLMGAARVVCSDGDVDALANLRYNMTRNLPSIEAAHIHCPQLIWGEELEAFRDNFGIFDLVLASDCVYMEKCVEPFWETIDFLLEQDENARFIYVNCCISQVPFATIQQAAQKCNFIECEDLTPVKEVHIFRRNKLIL